jgi:prephenate dehydratase/chorismate mutase
MNEEKKIDNPREKINAIDDQLLYLLNQRAELALRAGETKSRDNKSLCDHQRERDVLNRLCQQNSGPLNDQNVTSIFQRIMDECLQMQQLVFRVSAEENSGISSINNELNREARVAFQGMPGEFGEKAVIELMGFNCQPMPFSTIEDLFTAIDEGNTEYILVPLENSLTGSLHQSYDLLLESQLSIVAEIIYPTADQSGNYVRLALLATEPSASNQGNKISLIVSLAHRPGALHDALRPFVRRGIDLLKIESRPIKSRPWQYNFYLDLKAPASESEWRGALDEIRGQAEEVRFLGRYSSIEIFNHK